MEEHICPRRPYDASAEDRADCIHAYGVDFWNAKDVKSLFSPLGKHTIEWLDDSSLNVVFQNGDASKAMRSLCPSWSATAPPSEWFPVARKHGKKSVVEFRRCTTSDKKDIKHDGSQSVFYEHHQQQAAMRQQRVRSRREKKRARLQRHERKSASEADAALAPDGDSSSSEDDGAPRLPHQPNGFFDAGNAAGQGITSLTSVLAQVEATNRTASCGSTTCPSVQSAPVGEQRRAPATPAPGKKRRRPEKTRKGPEKVAKAPVRIIQSVHTFFQEHSVKHRRFALKRSFRSLVFSQQRRNATSATKDAGLEINTAGTSAAKAGDIEMTPRTVDTTSITKIASPAEVDMAVSSTASACTLPVTTQGEKPKPSAHSVTWDEYLTTNGLSDMRLVHSILYAYGDDQHVLAIIPHPMRTNEEVLAKVLRHPTNLRMCKLKEVEKFTQCPVFVCVPFGLKCQLLVDSQIVDSKVPLLFDLGTTAVSVTYSEFLRSCLASCVEGLAFTPKS